MRTKGIRWLLLAITFLLFACAPAEETDESPAATEEEQTEEIVEEADAETEEDTEEADQIPSNEGAADDRLFQFYIDLMNSGKYTLVYKGYWEDEGSEEEVRFVMSYFDNQSAMQIEDSSGAIVSTTIMDQEEIHIVSHEEETVVTMPFGQMYEGFELQDFEDIETQQLEFVDKGTAEFLGNTREYEEYTDGTSQIIYYFDGEALDGMEFVTDGETTTFDLESFSSEVDGSLFDIPEHYERTNLNF